MVGRATDGPGPLRAPITEDLMAGALYVLLVDDDEDIRAIGAIALEQVGGLTTATAANGPEALVGGRTEQPDAILLDAMMPGLDGPATLARLRADPATAHIPVIFLTARVQQQDVSGYLEAGAAGVIAKPFDPLSVADEVRAIIAELPAVSHRP